jgi:anti-sigma B factor antagonist
MTITKTIDGDTLTVAVEGWLDTMTAPQFHEAVQDLGDAKNVILDLGGVDYISSAGLRETVALFRTVSGQGGTFSVRRVVPGVMDVFTLTGFHKKFEIRAD